MQFERNALLDFVRWLAEQSADEWLKEQEKPERRDKDAPAPEAERRAK
jgi:hypothetical protein